MPKEIGDEDELVYSVTVVRGSSTTVTREILRTESPVRIFIEEAFPHSRSEAQKAGKEIRYLLAPTHRPRRNIDFGRVACAVDYGLRMSLDSFAFESSVALAGVRILGNHQEIKFAKVAQSFARQFDKLLAQSSTDEDIKWQLCLCLAFLEAVSRKGPSFEMPYPSLKSFLRWDAEEVREVKLLTNRALDCLDCNPDAKIWPNPVLGNRIIKADGDLIVDSTLIELKTSVEGASGYHLKHWLYQVLAYVLLDREDKFKIDSVGLLLPRQRRFFKWPLERLMSGDRSLGDLRRDFRAVLRSFAVAELGWQWQVNVPQAEART